MKLRNQLLTLSLATLLVPWAGWKLVQELEVFLRSGQEQALLASARTVARALPAEFRDRLPAAGSGNLHLRPLPARPHIDGYVDDWTSTEDLISFASEDGGLALSLLAGEHAGQVFLHCRVHDSSPVRESLPDAARMPSDGLLLYLRSARGLAEFRVHTGAPGPLNLDSRSEAGGQMEGFWLEMPDGYQVELALPPMLQEISLGAVDIEEASSGRRLVREAGTLERQVPASWLRLSHPLPALDPWLAGLTPPGVRAWITDPGGWVLASSGEPRAPAGRQLTWVERLLYRVVAGDGLEFTTAWPDDLVRFSGPMLPPAGFDDEISHWGQDRDSAIVRNTVAVPLRVDEDQRAVVVMEATTDGLLLTTNRAMGRIMFTTLVLTVALVAGLWFFATRLSRRVQRLSGAVSQAMDESGRAGELPLTGDRDELGELARNNSRLLRAVAEYTAYLQKLAGRLSHELKTPLAIVTSSLENLGAQALDDDSRRYLDRAREGLDRQSAIVRAMSEASRLEAAIEAAEWERIDLCSLLSSCAEAYRGVHPERRIELDLDVASCEARCAPDLVAQALDKLVDNALSLTGPEDHVTIGLGREGRLAFIRVSNSGTRLPDVLPERLFDSLVSMREKGGGRHLGLGLHIVRLVAEAHGGRARARNLPGEEGVQFSFSIAN